MTGGASMPLTGLALGHYHHTMDAEITNLENRLGALLEAFQALRAENRQLTTRVATLQTENRQLNDKVRVVTERVERLLAQLPAEDEAS
jgi:chromosome segregation ATPase